MANPSLDLRCCWRHHLFYHQRHIRPAPLPSFTSAVGLGEMVLVVV